MALAVDGQAERIFEAYWDWLLAHSDEYQDEGGDLYSLSEVLAVLGDPSAPSVYEQAFERERQSRIDVDGGTSDRLDIRRIVINAWLGQVDEAVADLEILIRTPALINLYVLRQCLDYWPLRDHPRFQAILEDPANSQPLDLDTL